MHYNFIFTISGVYIMLSQVLVALLYSIVDKSEVNLKDLFEHRPLYNAMEFCYLL